MSNRGAEALTMAQADWPPDKDVEVSGRSSSGIRLPGLLPCPTSVPGSLLLPSEPVASFPFNSEMLLDLPFPDKLTRLASVASLHRSLTHEVIPQGCAADAGQSQVRTHITRPPGQSCSHHATQLTWGGLPQGETSEWGVGISQGLVMGTQCCGVSVESPVGAEL